jgi:hypothetical protein
MLRTLMYLSLIPYHKAYKEIDKVPFSLRLIFALCLELYMLLNSRANVPAQDVLFFIQNKQTRNLKR